MKEIDVTEEKDEWNTIDRSSEDEFELIFSHNIRRYRG